MAVQEINSRVENIFFKLARPLVTKDGELRELELRPPICRMFLTHGSFFSVKQEVDDGVICILEEYDYRVALKWLSEMSGVDRDTLSTMLASDMRSLKISLARQVNNPNPL